MGAPHARGPDSETAALGPGNLLCADWDSPRLGCGIAREGDAEEPARTVHRRAPGGVVGGSGLWPTGVLWLYHARRPLGPGRAGAPHHRQFLGELLDHREYLERSIHRLEAQS